MPVNARWQGWMHVGAWQGGAPVYHKYRWADHTQRVLREPHVAPALSGMARASRHLLKAAELVDVAPLHETEDHHVSFCCLVGPHMRPGPGHPRRHLLVADVADRVCRLPQRSRGPQPVENG